MNCDVPEIIKTISRKRYVKEKLFNQMFNELCAVQCEKQDVTTTGTEYSANFCSKFSNNVQKNPMDAFKLYGEHSNGISFWNSVAVKGRGHFKQYHPLTKLNSECLDEQWR